MQNNVSPARPAQRNKENARATPVYERECNGPRCGAFQRLLAFGGAQSTSIRPAAECLAVVQPCGKRFSYPNNCQGPGVMDLDAKNLPLSLLFF